VPVYTSGQSRLKEGIGKRTAARTIEDSDLVLARDLLFASGLVSGSPTRSRGARSEAVLRDWIDEAGM
jgi:hypothetical protein